MEFATMTEHICGHHGTTPTCVFWLAGRCNKNPCRFLHRLAPSPSLASWNFHPRFHMDRVFVAMQNVVQEDKPKRPIRIVQWTKPPRGFVKINCDGAFTVHGNKAAAGGVVRDSEGKYLFGFSNGLGNNLSVEEAELEAIKIGMEMALSRGYKYLIIESDCQVAVEHINDGVKPHHMYHALISSIIEMGKNADKISWNHIFREANSVADGLAKHGLSLCGDDQGVKVFQVPPHFIEIALCTDGAGKIYFR